MIIKLTQEQQTVIDDEDFILLKKYRWYSRYDPRLKGFYAVSHTPMVNKVNKTVLMHRVIMNAPKGKQVDHIDGDTLNNRKSNLRICTSQQNHFNSKSKSGSSIYKGVSWHKSQNKWNAYIKANGRLNHLGSFLTEKEGALAYNRAAKKYFGEFARPNVV